MRNNKILKSVSLFAFIIALAPWSSSPALAASAGLDTTPNVGTLPIAVAGQTGLTLNADVSGAIPPKPTVTFSGPITEGVIQAPQASTQTTPAIPGVYATTINTDGSVVIGSTASAKPVLSVNGAVSIGTPAFTATFPYLGVNTTNNSPASFTTSNTLRSEIWVNDTTSTMWGLAVSGSAPGAYLAAGSFYIDQNIAGPRLTIDTSGNVGINTLAPQAKLDVNGYILINSAGTVVEGTACSTTGLVGRDSTGALFDC